MRSLAVVRKSQAIGVILSGTASDGTAGVEAIRAAGGVTFCAISRDCEVRRYAAERHRLRGHRLCHVPLKRSPPSHRWCSGWMPTTRSTTSTWATPEAISKALSPTARQCRASCSPPNACSSKSHATLNLKGRPPWPPLFDCDRRTCTSPVIVKRSRYQVKTTVVLV